MKYPNKGTQEYKVLRTLIDADGAWVSKKHFIHSMYLTQSGRAIHNLENKFGWNIEHGNPDEHGFMSYRIVEPVQSTLI